MRHTTSEMNSFTPGDLKERSKRKFQLCHGYLLEFDQLARVLTAIAEKPDARKIGRKVLSDATGLTDRHVEALVNIGTAMGMIKARTQILTSVGRLIATHDVFMEARGTLEWCHYVGAGSFRNLVWFEVFNSFLTSEATMTASDWMQKLRKRFVDQYTAKTLGKNLRHEVRFIVDAYLNRNFKKLELLHRSGERLYARRTTDMTPTIFAATIYDLAGKSEATLVQVDELLSKAGSPGVLFAMDEATLRAHLEKLHERGWLRYETTHNLNQVRLRDGLTAMAFIKAYYENNEPVPEVESKQRREPVGSLFR